MSWLDLPPYPADPSHQLGAEDGNQYPGRLITIDELQRIYVEERGEGPPLLFIPGYGGDAAYFLNLADVLADEFRTIRYDRRGNSRSPSGWRRVTLEEQADDVARILDVLGIERSLLVASSNGCSIAVRFMLRHPDRLAWATLHEPFWSAAFVGEAAATRAQTEVGAQAVQRRRAKDCGEIESTLRFLVGDSAVEHLSAETRRRVCENAETGAIERAVFSGWTPSADEWAALARMPVGLMVGGSTLPFFAESVRTFEARLGVAAVRVPGGHGGFIDHADELGEALRPILRRAAEGMG